MTMPQLMLAGGGAGIRTPDTANMSRMLYQLSYTAGAISIAKRLLGRQ